MIWHQILPLVLAASLLEQSASKMGFENIPVGNYKDKNELEKAELIKESWVIKSPRSEKLIIWATTISFYLFHSFIVEQPSNWYACIVVSIKHKTFQHITVAFIHLIHSPLSAANKAYKIIALIQGLT